MLVMRTGDNGHDRSPGFPEPRIVRANRIARFVSRKAAASVVVLAALAAVPACAQARPATTPKRPVRVVVSEYDYGFKLSRQTVPAGRVTFLMQNTGAIVHNFALGAVKVGAYLLPGQGATMTVTLKKGEYTYICSVKYHAAQGMRGTLIVK
jgi:plastocyanin